MSGSGAAMRQPGGRLDALDPGTLALLGLAAAIATGDELLIETRSAAVAAVGVPAGWVDELLLQSLLMVGYPRALVAAAVWRRVSGVPAPDQDAELGRPVDWLARGVATCRTIYGSNYDRLRQNVKRLHPALDHWMVAEGYGRVLGRPALDLARRELCTVAQLTVLGSPRQLHSHLRGALHAGAAPTVVGQALAVGGVDAAPDAFDAAREVWDGVRQAEEVR